MTALSEISNCMLSSLLQGLQFLVRAQIDNYCINRTVLTSRFLRTPPCSYTLCVVVRSKVRIWMVWEKSKYGEGTKKIA